MPGLTNSLSLHTLKTYTLLTSVHNNSDDADATDDADNSDNYNRVIGIAQLKAFSCAKNEGITNIQIHMICNISVLFVK